MQQRTDAEAPAGGRLFSLPPAMRYPRYRQYWFGTLASVSGFQMLTASQLWLVHTLEDSPLFLGYVGAASAVPSIALNLFGGVVADKLDNKRLIAVTQTVLASLIFLLATLTLLEVVTVWHVLAIAFVAGGVNAFDQPARQALYPHLIEREAMVSAVALNASVWQGTRIVAPAAAGLIIAATNTAVSIYIAAGGFLTMAVIILTLEVPRIEKGATGSAAQDMLEGLRFIRDSSVFSFLIGMTFFNSFFGMAYVMLMPKFADDILGQGPQAYGALLGAGGVGSLIVTLWLGTRGTFQRKGLLLIGGAVMFGLSVATFGLTSRYVGSYLLAMALMFTSGAFNSAYMISIMSSLQMLVPDRLRGRVMGFYGMTWSIMPLGGMQGAAIASVIGLPAAIAVGGLAVSAFALGPAMINSKVRNLGSLLLQAETSDIRRAAARRTRG
ncbi:MAG: MFS transporter [Chloroflexi bacterium]|nr:MFS transporter [Chloroflexota bacterium]